MVGPASEEIVAQQINNSTSYKTRLHLETRDSIPWQPFFDTDNEHRPHVVWAPTTQTPKNTTYQQCSQDGLPTFYKTRPTQFKNGKHTFHTSPPAHHKEYHKEAPLAPSYTLPTTYRQIHQSLKICRPRLVNECRSNICRKTSPTHINRLQDWCKWL